MATLLSTLQAINAYPIPQSSIETAAATRELDLNAEATPATLTSSQYQLTKADLLMWLAAAPNVSQGGQSYTFDNEQRIRFRNEALSIYREQGDTAGTMTNYGYKGNRL